MLPVQLEEDAALILDRHPMLLHDRKERLGIPHFVFINQCLNSVRPFPEVNINSSKLQYLSSHLNLQLTHDTSDCSKEEFIPPFESKSSNVDAGVDFHHLHT